MKIPFLSKWRRDRELRDEYERAYAKSADASLAWVSTACIGPERKKVRFMRRDEAKFRQDSGWMLFSGEEEQPLHPAAFVITALPLFVRDDPSLEGPLRASVGTEWTRKAPEDVWLRIVGDEVVDQSGVVVGHAQ
ncbi:MAG: DUF2185 domain-containing protein [Opitutae bacterium]|nr:DUF2185 domain-containing protein [Opitutae bacterium]